MFKKIVLWRLRRLVRLYFRKHSIKLVVVVGSVGKTSTKMAIATILSEKYSIRVTEKNYNSEFSVPISILGLDYPEKVHSVTEWFSVFRAAKTRIRQKQQVQVIVQELGVDKPGDMADFMTYLQPDIAVVTSVSEEHMLYFGDIDTVAREELSVTSSSKISIINRDDIDQKFAAIVPRGIEINTYGMSQASEYLLTLEPCNPLLGSSGRIRMPDNSDLSVNLQVIGDHLCKAVLAGVVVGDRLGLTRQQLAVGSSRVTSVPGRMQQLRGVNGSVLIDDTYNSSPLAALAALKTIESIESNQRIVVLGSMNELGDVSAAAHEKVGLACDPMYLEWVVTIGEEAEKYLAPAAKSRGCQVKSFVDPYSAGGFVNSLLKPGAVALFKGSQNGIFAEEALKVVLHDSSDEARLVRQGEYWLGVKRTAFDTNSSIDNV